ncbi:MAG: hypothetical protein H7A46_09255 [Verrucomicrobiales bacterium]|nr:hypothetical protein [Verrucomicrobiales bacterium]
MMTQQKRAPEAWCSAGLFEKGIGHVVVARFKLSGEAEIGVFLLDVHCLGVKDAFFTRMEGYEYEHDMLDRLFPDGGRTQMSPACARKLVEDAVAYTRGLGLGPHADYRKACRVFGGIKAAECDETFTFGESGKPLYVQGPHDSPAFAQRVISVLRAKLGDDGFHFIVPIGPMGAFDTGSGEDDG